MVSASDCDAGVWRSRISERAAEVFGTPEKANAWLDRPTTALSGAAPAQMLGSLDGVRAVETLLGQIERGIFR